MRLLLLVALSCAQQLPIGAKQREKAVAIVNSSIESANSHVKVEDLHCENAKRIEDYSVSWFLDNTKPKYDGKFPSNALFYSEGMSEPARTLANRTGRVTIWDVWPPDLYNNSMSLSNPMRCIHNRDRDRQDFFEMMSEAYARKAMVGASVLHSDEHYMQPPADGIWARVELCALVENSGVDWIFKIREGRQDSNEGELFSERIQGLFKRWLHDPNASRPESDMFEAWLQKLRGLGVWVGSTTYGNLRKDCPSRRQQELRHERRSVAKRRLLQDIAVDEEDTLIPEENLRFFDQNVRW
ncbi:hypothetical protein JX265_012074 [Neoarthrinium moseri]|uniref:Uncharacterized protein n=1 Tax=Neoarthrinium moseri TaxID=1658444 RepID=A0A9Q0AJV8_9PEZI|nr:hypothetical protein JX266_004860 [Neoarthrinium moseri]KAI1855811.1 hypothetical protein JX265_012074 [Neoarthrinium moseri]